MDLPEVPQDELPEIEEQKRKGTPFFLILLQHLEFCSHLLLSKGDNCSQAIISHSPISAVLNSLREFWLAYTLVFLTAYFVSYKTCIALFFVFLKLMIYSLQHKNSLRVHWKKSEVVSPMDEERKIIKHILVHLCIFGVQLAIPLLFFCTSR